MMRMGATGGLSASAERVTGKTLLGKPAVAPNSWMFLVFNGLLTHKQLRQERVSSDVGPAIHL